MPSVSFAGKKPTDAQIISILSDPTRWAILEALKEPKSASQVAEIVDLMPANVMYHLDQLVAVGVVEQWPHPDLKRRFIYSRRNLDAKIRIRDRKIDVSLNLV